MGVGWFELIALGVVLLVGVLFSAITLRLACWVTNRILPGTPISADARAAEEAGPTYRTVEAGPFTSPATAQMDPSGPPREHQPAVPEPHFLHAAGVAVTGLVVGGAAALGWMVASETLMLAALVGNPYARLLVRDLGAFGCFAGVQYFASVLLLPTSLLRALLVTFLHLVGLMLLAVGSVFLIGMGIHALTPR